MSLVADFVFCFAMSGSFQCYRNVSYAYTIHLMLHCSIFKGRECWHKKKIKIDKNYQNCRLERNRGTEGKSAMISADLGTQLESFVSKLVETGRYNSKSEVLREGIRLIQEREARLAVLDQALARGLADAEAGRPAL